MESHIRPPPIEGNSASVADSPSSTGHNKAAFVQNASAFAQNANAQSSAVPALPTGFKLPLHPAIMLTDSHHSSNLLSAASPPNPSPSVAPSAPSAPSASTAGHLGLAGLTILPIPDTDVAATICRLAEEHSRQLDTGLLAQDTLIFYNATAAHIDAIEKTGEEGGGLPGRITFFGEEDAGLFFLRMPQPIYEVAHLRLFRYIQRWIFRMGLEEKYYETGASTYKGIGTRQKEGDSGLRPDPPRQFGNSFPTLVVEVGNSESLPRLYKDKDWWFDNSPPGGPRGDVKVVLVIKVCGRTKRILLEQWYRGHQSPSQTITIAPRPGSTKSLSLEEQDLQDTWVVTGAPMVIPFDSVFLRPRWGGAEADLVLSERDLALWAVGCWKAQTSC